MLLPCLHSQGSCRSGAKLDTKSALSTWWEIIGNTKKSSIKPPGDLFISNPFEGGLKRRGAYLREGAYLI